MSEKSVSNRYQVYNFKLNALLEITQAINANLPVSELLARYRNILQENLNIGRILIFKYQNGWECLLNTMSCEEVVNVLEVLPDLQEIQDIRLVTNIEDFKLKDFDFVIPVFNNNNPLAYVLIGDIDEESSGVSPVIKHLNFIQTLSNIIIVAIENIRLFKESLKQEAFRKEMELASRMQAMLVPAATYLPRNDKYLITAFYQPHFEVGGDYYDVFEMENDVLGFCIADVSGKGISAALLMSNFQATLRALFSSDIPLDILVNKLNERVLSNTNGEKFITFFIGRYNIVTRELEYLNAGHNPPLLYEITSGTLTSLKNGCVGLGMLDDIPMIKIGSYQISGNTKILCFTDGIIEIFDGEEMNATTELLEKHISNSESIDEDIQHIIADLSIVEGNDAVVDDVTMLGVQLF
jgi:Serine phosphatase RsbU, regulator of sigma subunit